LKTNIKAALIGALALGLAGVNAVAAHAVGEDYAIQPRQNQAFIQASSSIAPQGGDDFTVRLATTLRGARKMPFPVYPYGERRTQMYVSSNGNIQFPGAGTAPNSSYSNGCLPTRMPSPFLAPYWDDLEFAPTGTTTPNEGIYTKVLGDAPNRRFIVNWRGHLYAQPAAATRFGVIFYEGQSKVSFQYMQNTAASATIGTQHRPTTSSTQWTCNSAGTAVQTGLRLDFVAVS
jgi:hypothetical protein